MIRTRAFRHGKRSSRRSPPCDVDGQPPYHFTIPRVPRAQRGRRLDPNRQNLNLKMQRMSHGRLLAGPYADTAPVSQARLDGRHQSLPSMTLGMLREDPAQAQMLTRRRTVIVARRFRSHWVALETHSRVVWSYRRLPLPDPCQHPVALGCRRSQAPSLSHLPNGLQRRLVVSVRPINQRTRSTG
jgi:hypothetical protein